MSPSLAALLTWVFVLCLLWRDVSRGPRTRPGLWVATIWATILASRVPSYWFDRGGELAVETLQEGNSFNQGVYLTLIVVGFLVLLRRRVSFREVVSSNRTLFVFLGFWVVSAIWADYPFSSLKGSTKAVLGNLVMALIILTDDDPVLAIKTVLRRCAFVVLPFSIMAIKYFPDIGRETHRFSDATLYTGIATGSNGLSTTCFICSLVIIWELIRRGALANKERFAVNVMLLLMIAWLLGKGDGATAGVAMTMGTALLLLLRYNVLRGAVLSAGRHVGVILVLVTPLVVMNYVWVIDTVANALGRSETLWGRLELWRRTVELVENPLLGAGYNSFWQGERLAAMWEVYWWNPTQAHSGYVETYLNLGWVGVGLLVAVIVVAGRKATDIRLQEDLRFLKLPYLVPILFFNLTEAAFRGLHIGWFVFLLCIIETRQQMQHHAAVEPSTATPTSRRAVHRHWRPAAASARETRGGAPAWHAAPLRRQ